MLSYEQWSDKRDLAKACDYINTCQEELEKLLEEKYNEPLFKRINKVLCHVAYATKTFILNESLGSLMCAYKVSS